MYKRHLRLQRLFRIRPGRTQGRWDSFVEDIEWNEEWKENFGCRSTTFQTLYQVGTLNQEGATEHA
jgi:hypothetical protein